MCKLVRKMDVISFGSRCGWYDKSIIPVFGFGVADALQSENNDKIIDRKFRICSFIIGVRFD